MSRTVLYLVVAFLFAGLLLEPAQAAAIAGSALESLGQFFSAIMNQLGT